jgi:hypothetical protein
MTVRLLRSIDFATGRPINVVTSQYLSLEDYELEYLPELGGYWFFVILTGVDIMDEYRIMEIRVYI